MPDRLMSAFTETHTRTFKAIYKHTAAHVSACTELQAGEERKLKDGCSSTSLDFWSKQTKYATWTPPYPPPPTPPRPAHAHSLKQDVAEEEQVEQVFKVNRCRMKRISYFPIRHWHTHDWVATELLEFVPAAVWLNSTEREFCFQPLVRFLRVLKVSG